MAKKRGIRVRVSHQRIEALHEVCGNMIEDFAPGNEHQRLLYEYMQELHHRLRGMLREEQYMHTLVLTSSEAAAFYQLWQMLDIRKDKYATIIVDSLIQKMSLLAA